MVIMPPKKRGVRQTVKTTTVQVSPLGSCSTVAPPDHPQDTENHEHVTVPESGNKQITHRVLSPAPSDGSRSEGQMEEEDKGQKKPKKKKPKTHTHLTKDQEEAMIDWLKSHEVLYNKKLEGYKDTKRKAFLWQNQAEVMDESVDELRIWYNSLRTRYTKLKKKKSGDGAPEHSDRDIWVLDNFSFLAPFTYEVKKRTLVSVSTSYVCYLICTILISDGSL